MVVLGVNRGHHSLHWQGDLERGGICGNSNVPLVEIETVCWKSKKFLRTSLKNLIKMQSLHFVRLKRMLSRQIVQKWWIKLTRLNHVEWHVAGWIVVVQFGKYKLNNVQATVRQCPDADDVSGKLMNFPASDEFKVPWTLKIH